MLYPEKLQIWGRSAKVNGNYLKEFKSNKNTVTFKTGGE